MGRSELLVCHVNYWRGGGGVPQACEDRQEGESSDSEEPGAACGVEGGLGAAKGSGTPAAQGRGKDGRGRAGVGLGDRLHPNPLSVACFAQN